MQVSPLQRIAKVAQMLHRICTYVTSDFSVRYIFHRIILFINRLISIHQTEPNPEEIEKSGKVKAKGETSVKPDVSPYLPD